MSKQLSYEDLMKPGAIRALSDGERIAVANVVLAFAKLDSMVAAWLIEVYGMPLDRGALMIAGYSLESKINSLNSMFKHLRMKEPQALLKTLRGEMKGRMDLRNSICHASCLGALTDESARIIFSPVRAQLGNDGELQIQKWPLEDFAATTAWATLASALVLKASMAFKVPASAN